MTETRKAIIELIEPYMNKTLSEWCLFYYWIGKLNFNEYNFHSYINKYSNDCLEQSITNYWFFTWIIWHYDITAVNKFFKNKYNCELSIIIGKEMNKYYSSNFIWDNVFSLPNKPLHLYTEEEDKDLLELLK